MSLEVNAHVTYLCGREIVICFNVAGLLDWYIHGPKRYKTKRPYSIMFDEEDHNRLMTSASRIAREVYEDTFYKSLPSAVHPKGWVRAGDITEAKTKALLGVIPKYTNLNQLRGDIANERSKDAGVHSSSE